MVAPSLFSCELHMDDHNVHDDGTECWEEYEKQINIVTQALVSSPELPEDKDLEAAWLGTANKYAVLCALYASCVLLSARTSCSRLFSTWPSCHYHSFVYFTQMICQSCVDSVLCCMATALTARASTTRNTKGNSTTAAKI